MQQAIEQFRRNVQRVRDLGSLYQALSSQTTQALDLSDLLRSQWVMSVSALDHYVHELVRVEMLEAFRGNRVRTDAFLRFQVSLESALTVAAALGNDQWLEEQIRTRNGYRSFQHPDHIADAIRLISDEPLWNSVTAHLQTMPNDVRGRLRVIVDRRNKIAHEADMYPSHGGVEVLWPIDVVQADEAIAFVEGLVEAIHIVVV